MKTPTNIEKIYQVMDNTGFVCWELYEYGNYNSRHARGTQLDSEMDIAKSKDLLKRQAELFTEINPNAIFIVNIKSAKTANGNGVLPEIYFSMNGNVPAQLQGLGSIQAQPIATNSAPENWREIMQLELDKMRFEFEKSQMLKDIEREKKELNEKVKELKDLEKQYKSETGKYNDVLKNVSSHIVDGIAGLMGLSPSQVDDVADSVSIAAVASDDQDAPQTEKDLILDEIDNYLNETVEDTETLKRLKSSLPNIVNAFKKVDNVTE